MPRKSVIYCDLFEKNAIKNQENGGIMLLESRSVPVQDEAYFQIFSHQIYVWIIVDKVAFLKIDFIEIFLIETCF
jgi:hypothetical protein